MSTAPPHKLTQLDRRILNFVAENPGCTKREARVMSDRLTRLSEWEYRCWRLDTLIQRGLVHDEGRPGRPSLRLTDEGWRVIFWGA